MLSSRLISFFVLPLAAAGACATAGIACSSTTITQVTITPNDAGSVDGAVDMIDPEDGDADGGKTSQPETDGGSSGTNPDGVPYPTKNIGFTARQGAKPGLVIPNFKFNGTKPQETTPHNMQLADVFDPQHKTHDIVAILGVSQWDTFSTKLMTDLDGAAPARVVIFSVLGEGSSPGTPATLTNLAAWRTKYPFAWNALDASFAQLNPLFDAAAVPLVCILDIRTMEIVSSGVGAPTDIKQELLDAAQAVSSRPPAY